MVVVAWLFRSSLVVAADLFFLRTLFLSVSNHRSNAIHAIGWATK